MIDCKEIEKNNRNKRLELSSKKIRDTQGAFHVKMDTIKDRNSMDLTDAEDIKKSCQEYTEELLKKKKISMTQITAIV